MDKTMVLSHLLLETRGTPTLLGGEPLARVIKSNKYVVQPSTEAQQADTEVDSLDRALHTALCAEVKAVLLTGPEGSGKTTILEKLMVDWARGEALQHFSYIFYFGRCELKALKGLVSLETLILQHWTNRSAPVSVDVLLQEPEKVLFVFDDLDQCELQLEPSAHSPCSNPALAMSMSSLVSSLLYGSVLKGSVSLVSARSAEGLRSESFNRLEVPGFLKAQRQAYVHRFFSDSTAGTTASAQMERTLGFHEFCSSPRFCWTVCSLYQTLMDAGVELPETLSQLCVHILVQLLKEVSTDQTHNRELVLVLGRLASHCLLHQHPRYTKEELCSVGFSPFLSQIHVFMPVDADLESCDFSFVSRPMQEFILALSVFLDKSPPGGVSKMLEEHRGSAGYLDLFLAGLSEPQQYRPLEGLLGPLDPDPIMGFRRWFKSSSEKVLQGYDKDQQLHCFRLLHQAQSETLVRETVTASARTGIGLGDMDLHSCVALSYVVSCLGEMKLLNLYGTRDLTEEKARVLAPVMSLSRKILLIYSSLTTGAVRHLASALTTGVTSELDLSHTGLGDEKFKVLSDGLKNCALLKIRLPSCTLTEVACDHLVTILTSGSSQLCELELMFNQFGDQGFVKLCSALHSPHCKLQLLQLQANNLTAVSMESLSAALRSGHSRLRSVNLTQNRITDSGVRALCQSLRQRSCQLSSLNLFDNDLTHSCCHDLMEALTSANSSLLELDLSLNDLGQEGALLLCQALTHPGCALKKLVLKRCELTPVVFEELGSLLRGGSSRLCSLDVGINNVGDEAVKHLLAAVADPQCLLEELDLEMTGLTDDCLEHLCTAIQSSRTLKNLELRNNSLTDSSVPALVQVVEDSTSMMELNLKYNDFSEDVFPCLDSCAKVRY